MEFRRTNLTQSRKGKRGHLHPRDTAAADSWKASLPSDGSAGATWLELGCGQGGEGGNGHPLWLGAFGPVLLQALGSGTAEVGWPSQLGEKRGPQPEELWESFMPLRDLRPPAQLHLPWTFFVLSTKHFAKENREGVEENPHVMVARPPPAAAFVHDSMQPHQAIPPLSYLHVFPFPHPSQGCI